MPAKKNLIGKRFGRLVVVEELPERKKHNVVWKCKCDCGKYVNVISGSLNNGNTKSCGCLHVDSARKAGKAKGKDLTNKIFGKLTVLEKTEKRVDGRIVWKCLCECGNICEVTSHNLLSKNTTSCGCRKESIGVEKIKKFLKELSIAYIQEYRFDDCKNKKILPFDFYLPDYNCCTECDGDQHFRGWCGNLQSLKKIQMNDNIKNNYCQCNNIKLIRIPYFDWDKITAKYLQDKIRN